MRQLNFERLSKVLFLDGEPDRVPFYELFADPEIMEAVTGKSVPYNIWETKKDLELYLKVSIKFCSKLDYDYVRLEIPFFFSRDNVILADDTAERAHPKRFWQDENRGPIKTREDFDQYTWPDLDKIQDTYLSMYEFVKRNLPEGMMILPMTSGGVLENVMWLMGAVPFFRALYVDTSLVRDMFEKVGKIISYSCGLAAEGEMAGAVVMGDDMGIQIWSDDVPGIFKEIRLPLAEAVR